MAFAIYIGLAMNNGVVPVSNLPIIGEVVAGAPAANNDMRSGDIIKSINGKNISYNFVNGIYSIKQICKAFYYIIHIFIKSNWSKNLK